MTCVSRGCHAQGTSAADDTVTSSATGCVVVSHDPSGEICGGAWATAAAAELMPPRRSAGVGRLRFGSDVKQKCTLKVFYL